MNRSPAHQSPILRDMQRVMPALTTVVALLLTSLALADEPATRWTRNVTLPPLDDESLAAMPLDSAIYKEAAEGLTDLRLLDEDGREISFLIRRAQETGTRTNRQYWPATDIEAQPTEERGLEVIVPLPEEKKPDGIRINTPLKNFQQRVRLFVATEAGDWQPVGEPSVIFDYTRYIDVRDVDASFDPAEATRLKIVIDDVTAEQEGRLLQLTRELGPESVTRTKERFVIDRRPFRIDRIEFWREVEEKRVTGMKQAEYDVTNADITETIDDHETTLEFSMAREPITSLELITNSNNFSRRVLVEIPMTDDDDEWKEIGQGTVTRIALGDFLKEELKVTIPETRSTRFRITIANRDSPPLEITAVKAQGPVYELVWLAKPESSPRLVFGASDFDPPNYDVRAISELLDEGFVPAAATLDTEVREAPLDDAAPPFRWSALFDDPRVVFSLIAILAAILGWALFQAGHRLPDPEGAPPNENSDASSQEPH